MVMAPAALALGLLWSAAADVVLGPRTRNGASLVNIAKLPLHTKGTLIGRSWLMIAMICTENNLGWSIHELGTPIYQQLITRLVLSGFFLRNHVFFTVGNVGFLWILPSTSSGIEVLPNPIRQLPFTTCCLGAIKIMQKQQVYYWVYRMIHAKMGLSLRKLWT